MDSFSGMKKAFSTKTMMRLDNYFRYKPRGRNLWKEPRNKYKKFRRGNKSLCGLWASLDDDLLHSIMMTLNIVDYFAVGAVCRSWRSAATSIKDDYMKQQKPLVIVKSKWAKKTCFLYDIFDGEEYKLVLPDLQNKRLLGLSCGYMITLDIYGFWLINLMTRHELRYPVLPKYKAGFCCNDFRSTLFNSTQHPQLVFMIINFERRNCLLISHNGAERWKVYTIPNASRGIADVKVFNMKIYVVSVDANICVLDFSTCSVMKLYNTNIQCTCTHLAIMDDRLCMKSTLDDILYELDDKNMVWVEKKEMGKYSLFLDRVNATMVDTNNWGAGNCICALSSDFSNEWSLRLLGHANIGPTYAPVIWNDNDNLEACFWYYPDKSYAMDRVNN